jgi:hypothetical protein
MDVRGLGTTGRFVGQLEKNGDFRDWQQDAIFAIFCPLQTMAGTIKIKLIAFFIAISLSVTWFLYTSALANGNSYSSLTPFVFTADSHTANRYDQLSNVWRARIGGNWITGRLSDAVAHNGVLAPDSYHNIFGFYNAAWLFLTFAIIICLADNPLFVIPFVFAGMCYSLTPLDYVTIFPWDMPSMFFWTLAVLFWERKKYAGLLATIVIGTVFKETVAVTAFLFFFTLLSNRKRWCFFGAAFLACLMLRLWITDAVLGRPVVFTADANGAPGANVLKDLVTLHLNHFIWINAGTFLICLFLPMKSILDKGAKCVLIVFFVCTTAACALAGTAIEFRQFLDVLPLSVFYLNRTVQNWKTPEKRPEVS